MKWKRAKKLMLCAMAVLTGASALTVTQPQTVEAATPAWSGSSYNNYFSHFEDFGEPRLSYSATYADPETNYYVANGSQGSWVWGHVDNDTGLSDYRWLYAINVLNKGTGNYKDMGNITVNAHVHNYGWTNVDPGNPNPGSINGLDYQPGRGWIEAIQFEGINELGEYAYIQYQATCNPVSEAEVRRCSGGHFDRDAWLAGWSVCFDTTGQHYTFFSNSPGAVINGYHDPHFNWYANGNWAGTAGYSMPVYGFAAMMNDYPCRVYINPNGGQWAGATNTVQVGQNGGNTAVRAGDAITFRTDALPTRAGYEFAGWDVSYWKYSDFYQYYGSPLSQTYYQSPSIDIIPNVCSGDGSEIHNDINMQPIYHLSYESHQSFDFSAVYNYQYYRIMLH